jgi:glutamate synthase domain-containing protein 2
MPQSFQKFITYSATISVFILFFIPSLYWVILLFLLLITVGFYDMKQTKHSLWRNYPIFGRFRWVLEELRPPIRQYFIESDIDGVPFNRQTRGLVYRRSKNIVNTIPFGTKEDVYKIGYEWIGHSLKALQSSELDQNPRVMIGNSSCKNPYSSSIFNISAMSYGALSPNAILALGNGARLGNFSLNTGEGGISSYHLESGADLIWQIGTGYFGCRDKDGKFDPKKFQEKVTHQNIKMIELKLSQGAKPGHGGILPAHKNTPEIASQRDLQPHTQVDSPPTHSSFNDPLATMEFIQHLRELSGAKPIGFKLCIGEKDEFLQICKAMVRSNIKPDFITIDGAEGGTGAAPLEYTNHVGMPLRDALVFVVDSLKKYGLKKDIKIIASGRITNGMDIAKNLALGADLCASARGMMFSLGCIQALQCHKNSCPTGIATQDKSLYQALVVEDKKTRVKNYQKNTIKSFIEIIASAGLKEPHKLQRKHISYRISPTEYKSYEELFPSIKENSKIEE